MEGADGRQGKKLGGDEGGVTAVGMYNKEKKEKRKEERKGKEKKK